MRMVFERLKHLTLCVYACVSSGVLAQVVPPSAPPAESEVIVVTGLRGESRQKARGGKSVIFTPREATRVDTAEQLKRESSVVLPDTGRSSPSGFVVPRVRGQDARYTEVWFEDVQLQDPYSGLPLVDSIDLRAFGELEFHTGFAPPSIASTSSTGIIRYRMPAAGRQGWTQKNGIGVGDMRQDAGGSVWNLTQHVVPEGAGISRLYLRHHRTSGIYRYYDDNGTPYNSNDDQLTYRKNNGSESLQALPWLVKRDEHNQFSILGWLHQATHGVPLKSRNSSTKTREKSSGSLGRGRWQHDLANGGGVVPKTVFISFSATNDLRTLLDPERALLLNSDRLTLRSDTYAGNIGSTWRNGESRVFMETSGARSVIRQETDDSRLIAGSRASTFVYAGGDLLLYKMSSDIRFVAEPKLSARATTDKLTTLKDRFDRPLATDEKSDVNHNTTGASLSFAILGNDPIEHPDSKKAFSLWLQAGRNERSPSLLERFGDGATIVGNLDVRPERINHYEAGGRLPLPGVPRVEIDFGLFADFSEDRVVIIPASADTQAAFNIGKSAIRGVESGIRYAWSAGHAGLGLTRLIADDLTGGEKTERTLPGIAPLYAAATATQSIPVGSSSDTNMQVTATSRYRGETWRDPANSISVPSVTIHDVTCSGAFRSTSMRWEWGLAVLNIADTRSVPIEAPGTSGSKGHTAYSEIDGSPLPGRQFKSEVTMEF